MKRKSNKITYVGAIILLFVIILLQLLLNKGGFQFIILLLFMFLAAYILVKVLRLTGIPQIVVNVFLPGIPILSECLAETSLAEYMSNFYNTVIMEFYKVIGITSICQIDRGTSITITFWLLFLIILPLCNRDRTAMKILKGSTCEELEKADYIQRSNRFCQALRSKLEAVNREYCWNEKLFTPIEAEVAVCIKGKRKRRFEDLLKCLKSVKRRGTIFLVLGNPGSGKSVAMRKLCLDLLDESKRTKRIPVYINLKKWSGDWSPEHLPDRKELIAFIKKTLYEDGDPFTEEFLDDYFDLMLTDGRWYFVFDSFDELPCFMGKQNCQEIIDKLSMLLYQFMTDTTQNGGIVASRLYKAPSESIGATVTLRLQEFSDLKIRMMLKKYLGDAKEVVGELFGKRESLVSLCRNPFYLTLLINYIQDNGLQFPQNQMELYQSFVERRLEECSDKMESECITKENVYRAAQKLAVLMQESPAFGLEYPVEALQGQDEQGLQKELKLLEYAQICRFGVDNRTISFIHRKFQEFFLVEHIMERGDTITYEEYRGIISNSGMRDALVLYCEVAEEEKAREIADFCYDIIRKNIEFTQNILKTESMELVNTLYFMVDAFRNRRSVIANFIEEFEELVIQSLNRDTDFVILLALSNCMILFRQETLPQMVVEMYWLSNRWLSDIIMQNCRVLKQLDYGIQKVFCEYFAAMNTKTFWKSFRDVQFSLSLSKSFRHVRRMHFLLAIIRASCIVTPLLLMITVYLGRLDSNLLELVGQVDFLRSSVEPFRSVITYGEMKSPMLYFYFLISMLLLWSLLEYSEISEFMIWLLPVIIQILLLYCTVAFSEVFNFAGILFFVIIIYMLLLTCTIYGILARRVIYGICAIKEIKLRIKVLGQICFTLILPCIFFIAYNIDDEMLLHISQEDSITSNAWDVITEVIGVSVFLGTMIVLVFRGIRTIVYWIQDVLWLKKQPDLRKMTRERLDYDLKRLHGNKSKRKYVERLLYKKVELTGKWPDDRRPRQMDDRLDYSLARLDCLRLENDNYLF